MKNRIIKKSLPVELTPDEVVSFAKKLAETSKDLTGANDRKKEVTADLNAKIKSIEAHVNLLVRIVSDEEEYRDIDCKWIANPDDKTKSLCRTDTMEVLETGDITNDDRQSGLFE